MMRYSSEEKEMWVDDWKRSGKSANAYAKENGLVPWTFIKWTKEEHEQRSGFVEIPTSAMPVPTMPEILIEKGDVKIHIPLGIGRNELRGFIECLGVAL